MKDKIISFIKTNYEWILLFLCLIGFLSIAEDVFEKEIMSADIIGYQVVSHFISEELTPIIKFITNIGGVVCIVALAIILLLKNLKNKIGIIICANLGIVTTLNIILKNILQRTRPIEYSIIPETGYSFPSGHSMISMAFYGYLIYLVYKNVKNKYQKIFLMSILSILIILIGISRIYLGVHYTSDVLGGFLIAIVYLILFIKFTNKYVVYGGENEKKSKE